jgi:hypothetical protein
MVPVGISGDVADELAVDHARSVKTEAHFDAQRALEIAVNGLGDAHHLSPHTTLWQTHIARSDSLSRVRKWYVGLEVVRLEVLGQEGSIGIRVIATYILHISSCV